MGNRLAIVVRSACFLHLQLERQLENVDLIAGHIGRIIESLGEQIPMLVVCGNPCSESIDDVVYARLDLFSITAAARLDAGESAVGLEFSNANLDWKQIKTCY